MTLEKRGDYWHGDNHQDIRGELTRYSNQADYPVDDFVDIQCPCGGDTFRLRSDEDEEVAKRTCVKCGAEHVMGENIQNLEFADLKIHECVCEQDEFQLSVGVHRHRKNGAPPTDRVLWVCIGGRCPACGLIGCYADWEEVHEDYQELLRKM